MSFISKILADSLCHAILMIEVACLVVLRRYDLLWLREAVRLGNLSLSFSETNALTMPTFDPGAPHINVLLGLFLVTEEALKLIHARVSLIQGMFGLNSRLFSFIC